MSIKAYIIPESEVETYRTTILTIEMSCIEEAEIKISLLGLQEMELEEAKKVARIGDCILIKYETKMMPFQVVHKRTDEKGKLRCTLMSFYLLEKRAFDQKTNVWADCELRKYLNDANGFLKKFDPNFVDRMHMMDVHTDNYVTKDLVCIPSHEEIGFVDKDKIFKSNVGAFTFDYYKQDSASKAAE